MLSHKESQKKVRLRTDEFVRIRIADDRREHAPLLAAGALAEELGGLPLALEQAEAYILAKGIALGDYLELFRTRRKELWKDEKPPADYRDKVDTTWNLAMDRVKEEAPEGADLLNLCAFLAPDEIPRSLFGEGNEHIPESLTDTLAVNRAVDALRPYSLIDASPENAALSVHRLVQAVTRDQLSDEERKRWVEAAVRLVNSAFPSQSDDVFTWDKCAILLPHAMAVADHAEKLGTAPESTCRLLNQAGCYLHGRAEFIEAKSAIERALKIGENTLGPDHPLFAICVNNLGEVLRAQYDLVSAKKLFERALKIDEKAFGPNHPKVAVDVNNLGLVLQAMGDLDGAKKLFERALKIDGKSLGPDHPKVAIRLNNLGRVLQVMGDLVGARKLFERALDIGEKTPGSNHPQVGIYVNNLGAVLKDMGDFIGAKKCYERALEIGEESLGPNHPNVAIRLNNLGVVLKNMGDLVGARKCYERALKIFRERLGEDHPKTVTVRNNLNSLGRKPRN